MAPKLSSMQRVAPNDCSMAVAVCTYVQDTVAKCASGAVDRYTPLTFRQYVIMAPASTNGDGIIVKIRLSDQECAHVHVRMYRAWREDSVMGHRGRLRTPTPDIVGVQSGKSLEDPIVYFDSGNRIRPSCKWAYLRDWVDVMKNASFISAMKSIACQL